MRACKSERKLPTNHANTPKPVDCCASTETFPSQRSRHGGHNVERKTRREPTSACRRPACSADDDEEFGRLARVPTRLGSAVRAESVAQVPATWSQRPPRTAAAHVRYFGGDPNGKIRTASAVQLYAVFRNGRRESPDFWRCVCMCVDVIWCWRLCL